MCGIIKFATNENNEVFEQGDIFKMEEYQSGNVILSSSEWAFKGFVYEINGLFSNDEARLLILEDFDKERQKFERLKAKFDDTPVASYL